MPSKKVVLLGDSIRIGYQPVVAEHLKGIAEVIVPETNCGLSRVLLSDHLAWTVDQQADVIHINAGLHDIGKGLPDSEPNDTFKPGLPREAIDVYTANVRSILSQLQSKTSAKIIWALTTPVNEQWHHERKGFDRLQADVDAYNVAAREVAESLNVEVNDLCTFVIENDRDDLLLPDGVHYKPHGYAKLGERVATVIRKHL